MKRSMRFTIDMREYPPHPYWVRESTDGMPGLWLHEVPPVVADMVHERDTYISELEAKLGRAGDALRAAGEIIDRALGVGS